MTSAEWLNDLSSYETTSIAMCRKCFTNANLYANDWMTMPHEKPHLLIWAKFSMHPYWPALLVKVSEGQAFVRFFGDQSHAWTSTSNCFLYSRDRPNTAQATTMKVKNQVNEGIKVSNSIE